MSERGEPNLTFWSRALDERTRLMNELATPSMARVIGQLIDRMTTAVTTGRKVLFFGNGGSAATAQHIAAELVGRYERSGRALPAMALTTDTSILTAIANDFGYDHVFERQVDGLARPGDVAIAFSTSGRSKNILRGLRAATRQGATTAALLGQGGGPARRLAEVAIVVPSARAPLIQEVHGIIMHVICDAIDRRRPRS
jgi:D-sedoheptulose 7-phosphate isomerase